jgi:hypothetical protein
VAGEFIVAGKFVVVVDTPPVSNNALQSVTYHYRVHSV